MCSINDWCYYFISLCAWWVVNIPSAQAFHGPHVTSRIPSCKQQKPPLLRMIWEQLFREGIYWKTIHRITRKTKESGKKMGKHQGIDRTMGKVRRGEPPGENGTAHVRQNSTATHDSGHCSQYLAWMPCCLFLLAVEPKPGRGHLTGRTKVHART